MRYFLLGIDYAATAIAFAASIVSADGDIAAAELFTLTDAGYFQPDFAEVFSPPLIAIFASYDAATLSRRAGFTPWSSPMLRRQIRLITPSRGHYYELALLFAAAEGRLLSHAYAIRRFRLSNCDYIRIVFFFTLFIID